MTNEKLRKLQALIQEEANFAWESKMRTSKYNSDPISFGSHLEFLLSSRGHEISTILDDMAREELKNQQRTPEPPDFSQYIRYSSSILSHKEVFVGDQWVLVPNEACVDFKTTSFNGQRAFSVTISHKSDYATFTSTERLNSYQEQERLLQGDNLSIKLQDDYVNKEEHDWMLMASQVYGTTKKNVDGLADVAELYNRIPKEFKRTYAYKISKVSKKLGKPAKAGKIFHGTEKVMKKAGKIAKVGPYLSAGTLIYEGATNTWDAHSIVDGTLLVVGIAATSAGAPVVIVGIAIYGLLDYAFDISEGIDEHFGRNSGFWDKKPVQHYPKRNKPLFKEIPETKIDKTYVAPKFKLPHLKD